MTRLFPRATLAATVALALAMANPVKAATMAPPTPEDPAAVAIENMIRSSLEVGACTAIAALREGVATGSPGPTPELVVVDGRKSELDRIAVRCTDLQLNEA
jgi:hypothetical protein